MTAPPAGSTRPLPCPFCGKANPILRFADKDSSFRALNCDFNNGGCGAEGGYEQGEDGALQKWNRRAAPPAGAKGTGLTREEINFLIGKTLAEEQWCFKYGFSNAEEKAHALAAKFAALQADEKEG